VCVDFILAYRSGGMLLEYSISIRDTQDTCTYKYKHTHTHTHTHTHVYIHTCIYVIFYDICYGRLR